MYLHKPEDNLYVADKVNYYFVFGKLIESPKSDPESVALSLEPQARQKEWQSLVNK